jgi:hypothetical protein
MTTRPPLSPVAKSSPVLLNSTHEIMSAEIKGNKKNKFNTKILVFYLGENALPMCT